MIPTMIDSLATRGKLTTWLESNATVTLECEPEQETIYGNASAIDEETDRETERYILAELESGNEWAWCSVKVTVRFCDLSATDYLGCCSYESEAAFKADGYYTDMVRCGCVDLVAQLFAARETLSRAWELCNVNA